MKTKFFSTALAALAATLTATFISLPAFAEQAPAAEARPQRAKMDCSKAADPAACTAHREARRKMAEACKGKPREEHRQCMQEQRQNIDCSKARDPGQCAARKEAYAACQGRQGTAFKECVRQQMPAADCSKAPDAQRCERHQQARAACSGKTGSEHRSCLRDVLAPTK